MAGFPAPTIPYPPSDSEDDDVLAPAPARTQGVFNRVQPPTPTSPHPGNPNFHLAGRSLSSRRPPNIGRVRTRAERTSPGELEMDTYSQHEDDEETGLTSSRRTRRQVGSDRHYRGPGGDEDLSKEEKKAADTKVARNLAVNLLLIGLWYLFSLLISIYNKWMFSPDHLNFHFPLFTTCLHMIVQFCLSSLVLFALPQFRPAGFFGRPAYERPGDEPESFRERMFQWNSRSEEEKKREQGFMTKWVYITRVAPCGAATGLDIGLGNMSLKFITLAFYTMCKSSSLAFVLTFAFLFRLEQVTWKLIGIISVMTLGVVMMVASEAHFVLLGFVLVITASALSGLRWALTQMLLLRNPATSNPFSSIFFLAPCMFVAIFVIAVPVEGFGPLFERFGGLVSEQGFLMALAIVIFPGVIAFLMVSSEFALLQRSSVVTLSICGIFKEVLTISASALYFGDKLTPINISGLSVTIVSIACYNYLKIQKMRQEQRQAEAAEHLAVESDSDDDEGATGTDNTIHHEIGSSSSTDEIRIGESAVSPGTARFSLEHQSSGLSSIPGENSEDNEQLKYGKVDRPAENSSAEQQHHLL